MNFLKKLGGIIAAVSGVFLGFAPAFEKAVPGSTGIINTVSQDLSQVGNVVVQIEAIGQLQSLSGPDKAKAAGPLVAQIIASSALVAGKKIADQTAFNAACVTIAGGVADLLNSLHADSANGVTTKVGA